MKGKAGMRTNSFLIPEFLTCDLTPGLWPQYRGFARSLCVITLALPFLTGCNMKDLMIEEMEAAYRGVSQKKGDTHQDRDAAVSAVLHKYFPPGMKTEEAFKLLRQLKERRFDVSEYRHEGARIWPDGELKPYLYEETRRNMQQQIPKGGSRFHAEKKYGTQITALATKHVYISFRVGDGSGVITEVKGNLTASGI